VAAQGSSQVEWTSASGHQAVGGRYKGQKLRQRELPGKVCREESGLLLQPIS
jgi:hypothetical protein